MSFLSRFSQNFICPWLYIRIEVFVEKIDNRKYLDVRPWPLKRRNRVYTQYNHILIHSCSYNWILRWTLIYFWPYNAQKSYLVTPLCLLCEIKTRLFSSCAWGHWRLLKSQLMRLPYVIWHKTTTFYLFFGQINPLVKYPQ